ARSAGYRTVHEFSDLKIFEQQIGAVLSESGPVFADLKITSGGPQERDYTRLHGPHVHKAFRDALAADANGGTKRRDPNDGIAFAGILVLLATGVHTMPASAQASDYPRRAITFMVGFAPGGGIDTFARVVAQELTEQTGISVVIENRAGAASHITAKAGAGAAPDGDELLFTVHSFAINQTLYKNPGHATEDLRPVVFVAIDSLALAVHAANPALSLPDFLQAGKTVSFNFGFGGSSARIAAEYVFNVLAKANTTGVPFQSGAPALNALLGRHVDIITAPVAEVYPQIEQGAVRALAVPGPRRGAAPRPAPPPA